ncbi:MAG: hypothetical protein FWC80_07065 [Firmicutes bacterium]|nr:hypothetical protein [Bacillota bacterium]
MAKSDKAYFGIESLLVNLILWFFLGGLLGIITAFIRGNILGGVIRILVIILTFGIGYLILWIIDLVTLVTKGDITVLA